MAFQRKRSELPSNEQIGQIIRDMAKCVDDPNKFVKYAFPWGVKGTPLAKYTGPKVWQSDEMNRIADFIAQNKERLRKGDHPLIYRSATASGRGIGKSTLVSWLSLWHISTLFGATCIISANTHDQLVSTTFAEIGKWLTLALNGFMFDRNQLEIKPQGWLIPELRKLKVDSQYYHIMGKLWDSDNPHSYAGPHSDEGMMLIFDEASGIPQNIWDVAGGYFTSDKTPYQFHFAFSNPRSNTGAFFDCFNPKSDQDEEFLWYTRNVNSLDVEGISHTFHKATIQKYGEDSDEARVEVKGQFPRQGDRQFISREVVANAVQREIDKHDLDNFAPLILGVDTARYGHDSTIAFFRRGRDARSIPIYEYKGLNVVQCANAIAELIDKHKPNAVCIDEGGSGAGVVDILKDMGYKIYGAYFGGASGELRFADHGTEMWANMREWLEGGMIPDDPKLIADLTSREYEVWGPESKIRLENKEKMRKRGIESPDRADALSLTFHMKVSRLDSDTSRRRAHKGKRKYQGAGILRGF